MPYHPKKDDGGEKFLEELVCGEEGQADAFPEEAPMPDGAGAPGPGLYVGNDPGWGPGPAPDWNPVDAGGVAPAPLFKNVEAPHGFGAPKPKPKKHAYAKMEKYDECCESAYEHEKITGLMVFYINVGNMGVGQSLDMIDKVKEQYKKVERDLSDSNIRVMWMPVRSGETHGQYFSFR
jgi:hypothetical protein